MSGPAVTRKWRPGLGLVVFSVLLAVLSLPAAIVILFGAVDATGSRVGPVEIVALSAALMLTLLIAFVLTRTITGPINALVERTREIASGGRAAIRPLQSHGTREIATLAQSFLDLAVRLVDRSEYTRSFAAHISHEFKSPMTAIKGAAELLREAGAEMTPEERDRFLGNIIADAERLNMLLARLRELAAAEQVVVRGETTVVELVRELAPRFPDLTIVPVGDVALRLRLSLETAAIAVGNLADNAQQHGANRLEISARTAPGRTVLRVSDNGRGISPGNHELVFQPFFSTRREQGGTGMGLDIARSMISANGGTLQLVPSTNGAAFEITLPSDG